MSATTTSPQQSPAHDALVVQQFGSQASAYVASAVHAKGEDIEQLVALAAKVPQAKVLDLGCGGGHVSYAAAKAAASVVAYDLSDEMLAAVTREAASRGLGNLTTAQGPAERLPFADGSFDVVLTRYSTHHWHDVRQGMREARRVLKPGGLAAVADVIAPEVPVFDTFLQTIEMLRDPSHVRDYSSAEWAEIAAQAGFVLTGVTRRRLYLDFDTWIGRMRTPKVQVDAILALNAAVSDSVRRHFEVQPNGTWTIDTAVFELQAV
jgi:SAM-dependent methyltransferase